MAGTNYGYHYYFVYTLHDLIPAYSEYKQAPVSLLSGHLLSRLHDLIPEYSENKQVPAHPSIPSPHIIWSSFE